MIAYIDIRVNAAHPNIPLAPLYAFVGSPSSVRVIGVPQQIGKWNLTAVSVSITLPDNSATTVPAVPVAGCWVATLPGCDETGYCAAGLQVNASGVDENGNAVTGYCLGVGDVTILSRDASAVSNGTRYYLHYVDEQPVNPNPGDMCYIDGTLKWYNGSAWQAFGADVEIVAPSTDPAAAGKAADAKATGDALAMKRGVTDLGVRGAPTPDNGGVFVINGVVARYDSGAFYWSTGTPTGEIIEYHNGSYEMLGQWGSADFTISAANGYRTVVDSGSETFGTFEIVGVLDSLATTGQTASTADVALAPVYGAWVCDPATYNGKTLVIEQNTLRPGYWYPIYAENGQNAGTDRGDGDTSAKRLEWSNGWDGAKNGDVLVATRTLLGYTLGSQATKPLAALDNPNFAPVYSASATYAVGALCVHGGVLYRCTSAISTAEAWNSAHWAATDVKTELAAKQDALSAAQLANIAAVPNKADASALRYDLGMETAISSASSEVVEGETVTYGAATLADRTANRVAITAAIAELRITFPAAVSGNVRDFGLRVEVGDGTAALTAPALVPVAPTGETITMENADGAIPALADGAADAKGVTLLYFSETAPGVFLVKGEEVKEA